MSIIIPVLITIFLGSLPSSKKVIVISCTLLVLFTGYAWVDAYFHNTKSRAWTSLICLILTMLRIGYHYWEEFGRKKPEGEEG